MNLKPKTGFNLLPLYFCMRVTVLIHLPIWHQPDSTGIIKAEQDCFKSVLSSDAPREYKCYKCFLNDWLATESYNP